MFRHVLVGAVCAALVLGFADPAMAKKKKKRIGSSTPPGIVNLTPIRPNAPVGPDLRIPRPSTAMPTPLGAPQPQGPYVAPSGVYPVPSRSPGETFQDRAVRCQHGATVVGVPDASRGSYVHNCAM